MGQPMLLNREERKEMVMKKYYSRCLAFLLMLSMLLQPAAGSAAEAAGGEQQKGMLQLIQDGQPAVAQTGSGKTMALRGFSEEGSGARETIYEGLLATEPGIDLEEYELTVEEFRTLLSDIINSSPELFYVSKRFSYQISGGGQKYVVSYTPSYQFGGDDVSKPRIEEMKTTFQNVSDHILSGVNPEWSDMEKALYIHDYLTSRYEYDTRDPQSGTDPCRYDAYSLIVEGRAVCEGYALAYLYFMKRLGIPCRTVPSDAMRHMWNQIQLGGRWYHVDVTWDDPLEDMPGRAEHKYFLKSDSAWKDSYSWDETLSEPCEDTSWDSFFWENSSSPLVSDGEKWFYVKNKGAEPGIYRWDPETDPKAERMDKLVDLSTYRWKTAEQGYYFTEKYTRSAVHQGMLYFNTPDGVLRISAGAEGLTLGEPVPGLDMEGGDTLYGLWIQGKELLVLRGAVSVKVIDGERVSVITALEPETVHRFEAPETTYPPLPAVTEPPRKTALPEPTDFPETTVTPGATESPETTKVPETTVSPGTTASPEETLPPEEGDLPSASSAPSGTASPVPSAPPVPAVTPAATVSPSDTVPPTGNVILNPPAPRQTGAENGTVIQNPEAGNKKTDILSQIRISAARGKKNIVVTVPKASKVTVGLNKKILLNKKKRYKKLTYSTKKTKSGKLTVRTSSRLKKKMKITVTVTAAGKKYKKIKRI